MKIWENFHDEFKNHIQKKTGKGKKGNTRSLVGTKDGITTPCEGADDLLSLLFRPYLCGKSNNGARKQTPCSKKKEKHTRLPCMWCRV